MTRRAGVSLAIVVVLAVVLVGWQATGPELTKKCPAPALRPGGSGWSMAEERIGGMNGAGSISGSLVAWTRSADGTVPERRASIVLWSSTAGGYPEGIQWITADVRGHSARIMRTDWPEPGTWMINWYEGGLGCGEYELYLSGPGVSSEELLAVAQGLR
jgi:hypothetical protein